MDDNPEIDSTLLVTRIITLALVSGVVIFGLIAVFVIKAPNPAQPPADPPMNSYVAAGFALVAFMLHLVIPNLMAKQAAEESNGRQKSLLGAFQTKTIIALAILEGAAFYNLVSYMTDRQWWSLAIAGGLVFWMLARFPSRAMIENWLQPERI